MSFRRTAPASLVCVCALLLSRVGGASPIEATEDQAGQAPAHISIVDGHAVLEREGRPDDVAANMPLIPGDRLRTERGRLEVLFSDGSALDLDEDTTVDLLSESLIRLMDGRLRLTVASIGAAAYRIDTPVASVQMSGPGEYRVTAVRDSVGQEMELATLRGFADLVSGSGSVSVHAGERSVMRAGESPSAVEAFNSAEWDDFDRWTEERREARLGRSSRYLPSEVSAYAGTFDHHGVWTQDPTYGYVWYPHANSWWRPYYNGWWAQVGNFGLTWIGRDPWAWPTHHFGRWGLSNRGTWFWIPSRRWAPAWVHWAVAPGYVAWCPLGFDGRPVLSLTGGGVFTMYRGNGIFDGRGIYDPWLAWTLVSRRSFAARTFVPNFAVSAAGLKALPPSSFAMQSVAPAGSSIGHSNRRGGLPVGTAVPRRSNEVLGAGPDSPTSDIRRSIQPRPGWAIPALSATSRTTLPADDRAGMPSRRDNVNAMRQSRIVRAPGTSLARPGSPAPVVVIRGGQRSDDIPGAAFSARSERLGQLVRYGTIPPVSRSVPAAPRHVPPPVMPIHSATGSQFAVPRPTMVRPGAPIGLPMLRLSPVTPAPGSVRPAPFGPGGWGLPAPTAPVLGSPSVRQPMPVAVPRPPK